VSFTYALLKLGGKANKYKLMINDDTIATTIPPSVCPKNIDKIDRAITSSAASAYLLFDIFHLSISILNAVITPIISNVNISSSSELVPYALLIL